MAVFKIDVQSVFAGPAESDPVISGHANRPAFRVTLQAMESKTCDIHVFRLRRYFEQLKDAHALPDTISADPACLAGEANLFQPFMPEAASRSFSVNALVYTVNGIVAGTGGGIRDLGLEARGVAERSIWIESSGAGRARRLDRA
jgi:hypothetical protein